MALRWRGNQVTRRLRQAQRDAVDATMADAVIHAKRNHPWRNRTGTAEGSIQIAEPAREAAGGVVGVWGSLDVRYFRWLEMGTARMAPKPSLRPAADATYGTLAARIRRRMR